LTFSSVDGVLSLLGPAAQRDLPLGPLTTYRVGGAAAVGIAPADEDALLDIAKVVREKAVPVLVVGRGSNMVVSDEGFDGLAVVMDGFTTVSITESLVSAGGGASLPVVARQSAAHALTGLEWAVGVPGSVGGGVRMNAGGHGSDIAACLERARIVDLVAGTAEWRLPPSLDLGYRTSNLASTDVVVAAELRCRAGSRAEAEALIASIVAWRRANQPGGQNAGSVFTNPPGDSAGRLIEASGLKGFRLGTAQVSPKHANFIQADEGGSAADVRELIDEVRARVLTHTGIELHTEVRLIGFPTPYRDET
jgi:UDP-N-acetylmuramate dehydrogenase